MHAGQPPASAFRQSGRGGQGKGWLTHTWDPRNCFSLAHLPHIWRGHIKGTSRGRGMGIHGFTQGILYSKGEAYLVLMKSQTRISPPNLLKACLVSTGLLPPPVLLASHEQLQATPPTHLKVRHQMDTDTHRCNCLPLSTAQAWSPPRNLDHPLNSLSFPAFSLKPCAHILRKLA